MKVALVHDFLKFYGGAERVLEALHEIFPRAPIFTAFYDPQGLGSHALRFRDWNIQASWLDKIPWAGKLLSPLKILAPVAFESFDLNGFDLIISSSNDYFAKAVITPSKALHISYIHTPPNSLYGPRSGSYQKHWWTKIPSSLAIHLLRLYDFQVSQRPDILVANSQNVYQRIKKFYRRQSVVIYPPVDIQKFKIQNSKFKSTIQNSKDSYYLSLGRLVRGKGTDIIIEACGKLGLPLKIAGTGPLLSTFKSQFANFKSVEFLDEVDDQNLPELMVRAKAVIVVSEDEDFGIVPVESMAAGTPVIALRAGGFLETVVEGKTGEFFDKPTVDSLVKVLKKFDPKKYQAQDCYSQAEKFSKERFKKEILELIKENLKTGK
ncbi:MAG: glycosyltransferase [Patescibacteria group bacterium]|nr:glycosyltransferase [Patescibacteria group bacterium]